MEKLLEGEWAHTADGEEQLFIRQVSEQKKILYGIAYSYLRNEPDALEVLQEATYRAWSKRKSLKDTGRFAPWMTRILVNCCKDELKRRKRLAPGRADSCSSSGIMEMTSDRKLDMEQALDGVKLKYRQVLVLKYYRDMTLPEIAEVLDRPEGTVKTWLNKGLKQLRHKMKLRGGLEYDAE
ncbi:sigma-70 family RNA polymerase sigma factor [Paenibacillus jilunlii]|uniref:RNA polymerase subunit sigma n=1 Tax=Paenibacillus jilunlii TaxID=682956 RepID=A0A1G9GU64_9BACL|nr:sigma-70 family RNA polymerase sigma factor [Paenibacillus jilunlii]KWX73914.1 RNA polymerase subunit sigma [Paenibacillus jilunlii]SDL04229.1 RNA polymerase, sigma subunit, SigV [Paenibacillus jilunlii]